MEAEVIWMEPDLPSMSMCIECRHQGKMGTCTAYPNGIPDRWLFSTDVHTQVEPDQKGTDVFESISEAIPA